MPLIPNKRYGLVQKRIEKIEKILSSKNLEVMFARIASNLLKRDNLEEAIQICEHGLKKFSTYAQGHYILAKCYQRKGMTEEAKAEFERALKFDFTHINSLKELAKIHKKAGLEDYYKEYLLKLFIIDPLNTEIAAEVKKAGMYDAWIVQHDPLLKLTAAPAGQVESSIHPGDEHPARVTETTDKKADRPVHNIYNQEKMDLSQFNNIQDDFTTILQGKPDSLEADDRSAAKIPLSGAEKPDWTEDIIYSFSDNTPRLDQISGTPPGNGEEGIETAVQDLSFDEETDKIIEKEQLKGPEESPAQITLDFPPEAVAETDADKKSAVSTRDEPVLSPTGLKAQEDLPAMEHPRIAPDTSRGFSLLAGEEQEDLPFKPPKIISQTLGEILVSQKKYMEALQVFKILRQKYPDNKNFDKKIEFLQKIIALEKEQHH
jgi:tetratricopeptide (TPR) repeat protein